MKSDGDSTVCSVFDVESSMWSREVVNVECAASDVNRKEAYTLAC